MDLGWWWSHLVDAGFTMVPLVACSVLALAVVLHKLVDAALQRPWDVRALVAARPALARGDPEAARAEAAPFAGPVARVLEAALDPGPAPAARAERAALRELDRLGAWLPVLAFVVQAAPLFGFLGTAVGMVDLFAELELSGKVADAGAVSGGIWKALLTTVAGLTIALPSLAAYTWMVRRLERLRRLLEDVASEALEGRTP